MSFAIVTPGMFHAVPLAKAFQKGNLLSTVLTTWPYSKRFENEGIPARGRNSGGLVGYLGHKADMKLGIKTPWERSKSQIVQNFSNRWLSDHPEISIYAFASVAERAFKKHSHRLKILDRASAHIDHQIELIQKEYEDFQVKPPEFDKDLVRNQVEEYELADHIVVPCDFVARSFELRAPSLKHKISVVPFGTGLNTTINATSGKLKTDSKKIRIGYMGIQSFQKGVPRLIEVVKKLGKQYPIELHLVGAVENDVKPWFKDLPSFIHYHGSLAPDEISKFYQSIDLFVLPSVQEGFSMVVCEALFYKVPVLASANSGADHLFESGHMGLIFKPGDSEILEKTLNQALKPNQISEWTSKITNSFQRFRSWQEYQNEILALMQKFVTKRSQ